jgi:hypothetical protein
MRVLKTTTSAMRNKDQFKQCSCYFRMKAIMMATTSSSSLSIIKWWDTHFHWFHRFLDKTCHWIWPWTLIFSTNYYKITHKEWRTSKSQQIPSFSHTRITMNTCRPNIHKSLLLLHHIVSSMISQTQSILRSCH